MRQESFEGVEHIHRWQEHQQVRLLECQFCGAWRLQEGMPGTTWEGEPFPPAEALLDQLAHMLDLTTQLLESHQLTTQEEAQCLYNRAVLEQVAQRMRRLGLQTNILTDEPNRT